MQNYFSLLFEKDPVSQYLLDKNLFQSFLLFQFYILHSLQFHVQLYMTNQRDELIPMYNEPKNVHQPSKYKIFVK